MNRIRVPKALPRLIGAVSLLWTGAGTLHAQVQGASRSSLGLDTAALAHGPYGRMEMLLEKTIFRVNVLTLTVRLGPDDAARIAALAGAGPVSPTTRDSIARIAARSTDAFARLEFRRTVSLGQFVDAIRTNLGKAVGDGFLSEADARRIGDALPRWFSFLEERKIHEGDRILYRIRGDTLHTVFLSADGEVLLDQTDVGPERRLAVLGSYFARGSDFRKGLLRSLLSARPAARSAGPASGPGAARAPGGGAPPSPASRVVGWAAGRR